MRSIKLSIPIFSLTVDSFKWKYLVSASAAAGKLENEVSRLKTCRFLKPGNSQLVVAAATTDFNNTTNARADVTLWLSDCCKFSDSVAA